MKNTNEPLFVTCSIFLTDLNRKADFVFEKSNSNFLKGSKLTPEARRSELKGKICCMVYPLQMLRIYSFFLIVQLHYLKLSLEKNARISCNLRQGCKL